MSYDLSYWLGRDNVLQWWRCRTWMWWRYELRLCAFYIFLRGNPTVSQCIIVLSTTKKCSSIVSWVTYKICIMLMHHIFHTSTKVYWPFSVSDSVNRIRVGFSSVYILVHPHHYNTRIKYLTKELITILNVHVMRITRVIFKSSLI